MCQENPRSLSQAKLSFPSMAKYWIGTNHQEEEEEEEEALSLCDLPDNLINAEKNEFGRESGPEGDREGSDSSVVDGLGEKEREKEQPEFDFGWWGNNRDSISLESVMCAADDLFFKGQILPLRLSHSSDNGLPVCRSMSRTESMDNNSVTRFIGSRSSSIGSYHSSSTSSSSANSRLFAVNRPQDPQNKPPKNHRLHWYPNPKPQSLNAPGVPHRQPSLPSTSSHNNSNNKSSLWAFFRTGLVRAPTTDIELRDLKLRGLSNSNKQISRNSSNGSNNSNSNGDANVDSKKTGQPGSLFNRNVITGLLGVSCKCSVETVPSNVATTRADIMYPNRRSCSRAPARDMVVHDGSMNPNATTAKRKARIDQKQAMSRQRASEWLEELSLSHAT